MVGPTLRKQTMDEGRKHDVAEINKVLSTSNDKIMRANARKAGEAIRLEQQSGWKKSMREALIRERKAGRTNNAKDISEDIIKDRGHQESHSFYFNLPSDFWKK
jgi:hypothetical protein